MPTDQIVAYFVRHGTTLLNEENKFRGPLNPPLDEKGIQDAGKLGAYFQNIDLGSSWSSDTKRAETTAKAILDPKGKSPEVTPDLRAWNVGYLAGEKKDEHQDEVGYFQSNPTEEIPNGESLNKFRQRVKPRILKAIHTGWKSGKPSLVVAHSSIIHELGNILHGDHSATLVKPGGVVGVFHDGKHFTAKPLVRPEKGDHPYAS